MPRVQIPDGEQPALQHLARISEDHFDEILTRIDAVRPTMHMRTFIRRVLNGTSLQADPQASEMLSTMLALMNSIHASGSTIPGIAESIAEQLVSADFLENDEFSTFRDRAIALLSRNSIALVSQAFNAFVSGGGFYQRSEISSTINPLYLTASSEGPKLGGASVIHELTLHSSSLSDEQISYRCLLDSEDLQELRKRIDQALDKADLLRSFATNSGLIVVEDSSDI